jgi:DNA-binding NarL/FixJ family response regulator
VSFDPSQCRILSIGKQIAKLEPFLQSHGYNCTGKETGLEALEAIGSESFHLVLMELNLRDIELRDFFSEALDKQKDAAFLIMAPPNLAEDVVSALVAGADGYIAVPPDEGEMFRELERQGAAAIARKAENPDAQPGMSAQKEKLEQLEQQANRYKEHAEKMRDEVTDLREKNEILESDAKRLRKELQGKSSGPSVPPGHKVVKEAELEELESKAQFIEFLESENDELKKELDKLRGTAAEDFDEPTGMTGPPMAGGDDDALLIDDGDGDEDALLMDDDDDGLLVLDDHDDDDDVAGAAEELVSTPAAPQKPAPPPVVVTPDPPAAIEADNDLGDFADSTDLSELLGDSSEEEFVIPDTLAAAPAAPAPARAPAPAPAGPAPAPAPPPVALAEEEPAGDDEFEGLNTDALLALAGDDDSDEMDDDELQALLDGIDD